MNELALLFLKREGVRRNALRVQRPTSPHLEDKRKHRMARPLRSRSRKALGVSGVQGSHGRLLYLTLHIKA